MRHLTIATESPYLTQKSSPSKQQDNSQKSLNQKKYSEEDEDNEQQQNEQQQNEQYQNEQYDNTQDENAQQENLLYENAQFDQNVKMRQSASFKQEQGYDSVKPIKRLEAIDEFLKSVLPQNEQESEGDQEVKKIIQEVRAKHSRVHNPTTRTTVQQQPNRISQTNKQLIKENRSLTAQIDRLEKKLKQLHSVKIHDNHNSQPHSKVKLLQSKVSRMQSLKIKLISRITVEKNSYLQESKVEKSHSRQKNANSRLIAQFKTFRVGPKKYQSPVLQFDNYILDTQPKDNLNHVGVQTQNDIEQKQFAKLDQLQRQMIALIASNNIKIKAYEDDLAQRVLNQ